ncbi:copper homeostasis/adhesion lipoprotein NlpE [Yersinia enterocolitica]|nr:copper homeostasis/adhesion lipoprotein NlpE [Yersinia enterocolitica]EKN5929803.1 copper homeostasis/adhesion lipoprotein NlpE [Yersinia enterocolitica]EKN5955331.1 copper homeostasis/adhesion lipoprotein NlpE [Yersinia enterocolitica]EKN5964757.1 copper homeostasis/adhesion lipoprotein NlpE [Yersinia enterocolitica]EKN5986041.1 copper homeostasis/adhesion lipoprotein NlpE [Yersinia enterocolitica]
MTVSKLTITLFLAVGALSLLGCNNRHQPVEQALQPMQQSYQGLLPCADCSGLDTSLFLDSDGTFVLKEIYRGSKEGDQVFAEYGKWARTADKLVLTTGQGEKRYFRPVGKNLVMLDQQGLSIESNLNYQLVPTEQPLPKTPMPLSGMYKYFADAAVFTDCVTGKTFPVENNIALEKGYLKARKNVGEPVFLTLNGYFDIRPSMEEGQSDKTLIPADDIQFNANKNCENR